MPGEVDHICWAALGEPALDQGAGQQPMRPTIDGDHDGARCLTHRLGAGSLFTVARLYRACPGVPLSAGRLTLAIG
jgi:hypothetical protein